MIKQQQQQVHLNIRADRPDVYIYIDIDIYTIDAILSQIGLS